MNFVNQLNKPLQASVPSTKFHTRILSTLTFVQAMGHGTAVPITAQEWNAAPLAAYQNLSLSQNLLSVWHHVRTVTIRSEDCDNHKKDMFLSYFSCLEIFDCGISLDSNYFFSNFVFISYQSAHQESRSCLPEWKVPFCLSMFANIYPKSLLYMLQILVLKCVVSEALCMLSLV